MNPAITTRYQQSPWGGAGKGMAWHHVIPYAVLRDVWNLLLDRCIYTDLAEARTALRHHLMLCCRRLPDVDGVIENIRACDQRRRRAGHRPGEPLDVPGVHELETAAVWQGWNIVEGPVNRSDDPGSHYMDRFTKGLIGTEPSEMKMVESLHGAFQTFLGTGASPSVAALTALTSAVSVARPLLQWRDPIRFRPEMWVQDPDGRWRKAR